MANNKRNKTDFFSYYQSLYPSRWESLLKAFSGEQNYAVIKEGLNKEYYLDPASARVAEAVEAEKGHRILDLCAAPGGKSLILALHMPDDAQLTVNDRSAERRGRLRRVLDSHLPENIRNRIIITGHDASRWGMHEPGKYDRILLDAPCSSERHVVQSPLHLAQWSPARTKQLAAQAFSMLASAFDALTPGGRLVYSTCSISPLENEQTVKRLIKKRQGVKILSARGKEEEPCHPGCRLWPDAPHGWGPIFYAVIQKE